MSKFRTGDILRDIMCPYDGAGYSGDYMKDYRRCGNRWIVIEDYGKLRIIPFDRKPTNGTYWWADDDDMEYWVNDELFEL
jgi:hypothetical protein